MKTVTYRYLKLLMVAVLLLNLTSCETTIFFEDDDEIGGAYFEKSKALCNYVWADTYTDQYGNKCYQELTFYLDRTGEDYLRIDKPNGTFTEDVYDFVWRWEDRDQYSLRMYYGPNDISYLDEVWIRGNILSGYLDDAEVDFIGLQ